MFWICAFHILRQAKPYGSYTGKKRAVSFGFLITASADFAKLCKFLCDNLRSGPVNRMNEKNMGSVFRTVAHKAHYWTASMWQEWLFVLFRVIAIILKTQIVNLVMKQNFSVAIIFNLYWGLKNIRDNIKIWDKQVLSRSFWMETASAMFWWWMSKVCRLKGSKLNCSGYRIHDK